jgi:hypothetical protein
MLMLEGLFLVTTIGGVPIRVAESELQLLSGGASSHRSVRARAKPGGTITNRLVVKDGELGMFVGVLLQFGQTLGLLYC